MLTSSSLLKNEKRKRKEKNGISDRWEGDEIGEVKTMEECLWIDKATKQENKNEMKSEVI